MSEETHFIYSSQEDAPFTHIQHLGAGSGGAVDLVRHQGSLECYARKSIVIPAVTTREPAKKNRDELIQKIRQEARIIQRLRRHRHIVEVVSTYETTFGYRPNFCILLLPIAERNLGEFVKEVDQMAEGVEKNESIRTMRHWAACLVRATDYMHYMHVKHEDIKPANILIRGNRIYITDFGIAKDFSLDPTTGAVYAHIVGTRLYCSSEALKNKRRGRSSDIFSLGCCLLEMATVMITAGKLETLKELRGDAYAEQPEAILQWIYYLFSVLAFRSLRAHEAGSLRESEIISSDNLVHQTAVMLPALAFVMMDPEPEKRATARQIVTLISVWAKQMFCSECVKGVGDEDPGLPLHSKFKSRRDMVYPRDPEDVLKRSFQIPNDWEEAKKLWLKDHMWW